MKTANFPERKRQRQLGALERLSAFTAGKRGKAPMSNSAEIDALKEMVSHNLRDVRTKKDRSGSARFRTA